MNEGKKPDSDLLSRFQELDQDGVSAGNTVALNQRVVASGELTPDAIGEGLLLSSCLAEILEQAQQSGAEFDGAFVGSSQGAIWEFVDFTGAVLGSEIRGIFQDNAAGVGLETAVLINELLDVSVQPISPFSLPDLWLLIANSRDELFGMVG